MANNTCLASFKKWDGALLLHLVTSLDQRHAIWRKCTTLTENKSCSGTACSTPPGSPTGLRIENRWTRQSPTDWDNYSSSLEFRRHWTIPIVVGTIYRRLDPLESRHSSLKSTCLSKWKRLISSWRQHGSGDYQSPNPHYQQQLKAGSTGDSQQDHCLYR